MGEKLFPVGLIEKEVLGFYFSGHPLLSVRALLRVAATHEISALKSDISGPVRLAGMLSQVKRMTTKKKGEPWARCLFEDLTGEVQLLVFPKRYAEGLGARLEIGAIVAVEGKVASPRGEAAEGAAMAVPEIVAEDILPLEAAASRRAKRQLCPKRLRP